MSYKMKLCFAFSEKAKRTAAFDYVVHAAKRGDIEKILAKAGRAALKKDDVSYLQGVFSGVVFWKRGAGEYKKDDDYDRFIVRPLLTLMEVSDAPAALAARVAAGMTETERKTVLGFSLREACTEAEAPIVAALLDAGADVNTNGSHPLCNAISCHRPEIISLLDARGADWEATPRIYLEPDFRSRLSDYVQKRAAAKMELEQRRAAAAPPPPPQDIAVANDIGVLSAVNLRRRPNTAVVP